jgi:hypothetical protein
VPYDVKRKALKEISKEDLLMAKKQEAFDYQNTTSKLETVAQMKSVSMKFAFERTMRDVTRRIALHDDVCSGVEAYRQRNETLREDIEQRKVELQMVQVQDQEITLGLERLQHEIGLHREWKAVQMVDMANLELKAKKHDMLKGIDFLRLEVEIKRQAKEQKQATRRRLNAPRQVLVSDEINKKKLAQMTLAIRTEEGLVRTIRAKIAAAKPNARTPGSPTTMTQEHWKEQAEDVEGEYELLKRRNEELRLATGHSTGARPPSRAKNIVTPPARPQPVTAPSIPTAGVGVKTFHGTPMPPGLATFMQRGGSARVRGITRGRPTWGSNTTRF